MPRNRPSLGYLGSPKAKNQKISTLNSFFSTMVKLIIILSSYRLCTLMSFIYYRKFQFFLLHYVITGSKIPWKIIIFGLFRVYRVQIAPKLYHMHIFIKALTCTYRIKKSLKKLDVAVVSTRALKMTCPNPNFTHFFIYLMLINSPSDNVIRSAGLGAGY